MILTYDTSRKSSNLKFVEYDDSNGLMTIEFKNKVKYKYEDVPKPLFEAFIKAPSAGKFFYANVNGKYKYSKIVD